MERLIAVLLKQHELMEQSQREAASLAVLDMRARMNAAGI